jgi:hypothetical protein
MIIFTFNIFFMSDTTGVLNNKNKIVNALVVIAIIIYVVYINGSKYLADQEYEKAIEDINLIESSGYTVSADELQTEMGEDFLNVIVNGLSEIDDLGLQYEEESAEIYEKYNVLEADGSVDSSRDFKLAMLEDKLLFEDLFDDMRQVLVDYFEAINQLGKKYDGSSFDLYSTQAYKDCNMLGAFDDLYAVKLEWFEVNIDFYDFLIINKINWADTDHELEADLAVKALDLIEKTENADVKFEQALQDYDAALVGCDLGSAVYD